MDGWVCTIYYQEFVINQYYLWPENYSVTNYRYLAASGGANSPPLVTAVPAMTYLENAGPLSNIVDLWFYAGDDRTPKPEMAYAITSQTNPGVVSCAVSSNRYISCSTQPSANGFSDITFSVKDAGGAGVSSTFRITITPAKPGPSSPSAGGKIAPPPTPSASVVTSIPSTPSLSAPSMQPASEGDTSAPETPAEE